MTAILVRAADAGDALRFGGAGRVSSASSFCTGRELFDTRAAKKDRDILWQDLRACSDTRRRQVLKEIGMYHMMKESAVEGEGL